MHDPQSLPVPYMKVTAAISHKNKTQNKIHENYFAWITLVIFEKGKKKKQSTAAFSHKIIIYYVTFTLHNMKTLGSLTNILQTFFGPHAIKFLKVRQSRNVFFKPAILPKYYDQIVSFGFWKNSRIAKSTFKIRKFQN